MQFTEGSKLARKRLGSQRRNGIIIACVVVLLYVYLYEYRDAKRARQWRVFFKQDEHMSKSDEGYAVLGIPFDGQCQAMARFGPPKADGGWNTCMQPPLLDKYCEHGKWDCPWEAVKLSTWPPKDCVVYSFGSAWNFMFEVSISRLGCKVHTFDPSMPEFKHGGWANKLTTLSGIEFHEIGLGAKDEESNYRGWRMMRLETIMKMLKTERLEILKVDIEFGEWDFLEDIFDKSDLLRTDTVRQVMLEIHIDPEADPVKIKRKLDKFRQFGFRLWARDDNDYCAHVNMAGHMVRGCIELSYVRTELKY